MDDHAALNDIPVTIQDLKATGFGPDQVQEFETLKATYDPCRECCESNREYEQPCFLKWRYERSEIREAITGRPIQSTPPLTGGTEHSPPVRICISQ